MGSDTINVISVSGGKDSTATLLLALDRNVENPWIVFCDTGNEHPYTYKYIDYLEKKIGMRIDRIRADFSHRIENKRKFILEHWRDHGVAEEHIKEALDVLKPTGNPFVDLCLWKGRFPSARVRFCTVELKINTVRDALYSPLLAFGFQVDVWQGIRREESPARSKALERDVMAESELSGGKIWNYRPILDWTTPDVFDFIADHGIEANPLYKMGCGRVGCMPCINARKAEVKEVSERFPDQIDKVREWEAVVSKASKRGSSTFFADNDGKGHGIDAVVQWSKTTRKRKAANESVFNTEA